MKKVINYVKRKRSKSDKGKDTIHKSVSFNSVYESPLSIYTSSESIASSNDTISIYNAGSANKGWTKLHIAAWVGDVQKIRSKLKNIPIDATDDVGRTALHLAASQGHANAIGFLLACKANAIIRDVNGKTALHKAMEFEHPECARLLLDRNILELVHISDSAGDSPLHIATGIGSYDLSLMLLQKGANLEVANAEGQYPLHKSCLSNTKDTHELIELLLRYGALINVYDNNNVSPLMLACKQGSTKVVQLFLEYGADKTIKDINGKTAYHYALESNFYDIERILNADIDTEEFMNRKTTSLQKSIKTTTSDVLADDLNENKGLSELTFHEENSDTRESNLEFAECSLTRNNTLLSSSPSANRNCYSGDHNVQSYVEYFDRSLHSEIGKNEELCGNKNGSGDAETSENDDWSDDFSLPINDSPKRPSLKKSLFYVGDSMTANRIFRNDGDKNKLTSSFDDFKNTTERHDSAIINETGDNNFKFPFALNDSKVVASSRSNDEARSIPIFRDNEVDVVDVLTVAEECTSHLHDSTIINLTSNNCNKSVEHLCEIHEESISNRLESNKYEESVVQMNQTTEDASVANEIENVHSCDTGKKSPRQFGGRFIDFEIDNNTKFTSVNSHAKDNSRTALIARGTLEGTDDERISSSSLTSVTETMISSVSTYVKERTDCGSKSDEEFLQHGDATNVNMVIRAVNPDDTNSLEKINYAISKHDDVVERQDIDVAKLKMEKEKTIDLQDALDLQVDEDVPSKKVSVDIYYDNVVCDKDDDSSVSVNSDVIDVGNDDLLPEDTQDPHNQRMDKKCNQKIKEVKFQAVLSMEESEALIHLQEGDKYAVKHGNIVSGGSSPYRISDSISGKTPTFFSLNKSDKEIPSDDEARDKQDLNGQNNSDNDDNYNGRKKVIKHSNESGDASDNFEKINATLRGKKLISRDYMRIETTQGSPCQEKELSALESDTHCTTREKRVSKGLDPFGLSNESKRGSKYMPWCEDTNCSQHNYSPHSRVCDSFSENESDVQKDQSSSKHHTFVSQNKSNRCDEQDKSPENESFLNSALSYYEVQNVKRNENVSSFRRSASMLSDDDDDDSAALSEEKDRSERHLIVSSHLFKGECELSKDKDSNGEQVESVDDDDDSLGYCKLSDFRFQRSFNGSCNTKDISTNLLKHGVTIHSFLNKESVDLVTEISGRSLQDPSSVELPKCRTSFNSLIEDFQHFLFTPDEEGVNKKLENINDKNEHDGIDGCTRKIEHQDVTFDRARQESEEEFVRQKFTQDQSDGTDWKVAVKSKWISSIDQEEDEEGISIANNENCCLLRSKSIVIDKSTDLKHDEYVTRQQKARSMQPEAIISSSSEGLVQVEDDKQLLVELPEHESSVKSREENSEMEEFPIRKAFEFAAELSDTNSSKICFEGKRDYNNELANEKITGRSLGPQDSAARPSVLDEDNVVDSSSTTSLQKSTNLHPASSEDRDLDDTLDTATRNREKDLRGTNLLISSSSHDGEDDVVEKMENRIIASWRSCSSGVSYSGTIESHVREIPSVYREDNAKTTLKKHDVLEVALAKLHDKDLVEFEKDRMLSILQSEVEILKSKLACKNLDDHVEMLEKIVELQRERCELQATINTLNEKLADRLAEVIELKEKNKNYECERSALKTKSEACNAKVSYLVKRSRPGAVIFVRLYKRNRKLVNDRRNPFGDLTKRKTERRGRSCTKMGESSCIDFHVASSFNVTRETEEKGQSLNLELVGSENRSRWNEKELADEYSKKLVRPSSNGSSSGHRESDENISNDTNSRPVADVDSCEDLDPSEDKRDLEGSQTQESDDAEEFHRLARGKDDLQFHVLPALKANASSSSFDMDGSEEENAKLEDCLTVEPFLLKDSSNFGLARSRSIELGCLGSWDSFGNSTSNRSIGIVDDDTRVGLETIIEKSKMVQTEVSTFDRSLKRMATCETFVLIDIEPAVAIITHDRAAETDSARKSSCSVQTERDDVRSTKDLNVASTVDYVDSKECQLGDNDIIRKAIEKITDTPEVEEEILEESTTLFEPAANRLDNLVMRLDVDDAVTNQFQDGLELVVSNDSTNEQIYRMATEEVDLFEKDSEVGKASSVTLLFNNNILGGRENVESTESLTMEGALEVLKKSVESQSLVVSVSFEIEDEEEIKVSSEEKHEEISVEKDRKVTQKEGKRTVDERLLPIFKVSLGSIVDQSRPTISIKESNRRVLTTDEKIDDEHNDEQMKKETEIGASNVSLENIQIDSNTDFIINDIIITKEESSKANSESFAVAKSQTMTFRSVPIQSKIDVNDKIVSDGTTNFRFSKFSLKGTSNRNPINKTSCIAKRLKGARRSMITMTAGLSGTSATCKNVKSIPKRIGPAVRFDSKIKILPDEMINTDGLFTVKRSEDIEAGRSFSRRSIVNDGRDVNGFDSTFASKKLSGFTCPVHDRWTSMQNVNQIRRTSSGNCSVCGTTCTTTLFSNNNSYPDRSADPRETVKSVPCLVHSTQKNRDSIVPRAEYREYSFGKYDCELQETRQSTTTEAWRRLCDELAKMKSRIFAEEAALEEEKRRYRLEAIEIVEGSRRSDDSEALQISRNQMARDKSAEPSDIIRHLDSLCRSSEAQKIYSIIEKHSTSVKGGAESVVESVADAEIVLENNHILDRKEQSEIAAEDTAMSKTITPVENGKPTNKFQLRSIENEQIDVGASFVPSQKMIQDCGGEPIFSSRRQGKLWKCDSTKLLSWKLSCDKFPIDREIQLKKLDSAMAKARSSLLRSPSSLDERSVKEVLRSLKMREAAEIIPRTKRGSIDRSSAFCQPFSSSSQLPVRPSTLKGVSNVKSFDDGQSRWSQESKSFRRNDKNNPRIERSRSLDLRPVFPAQLTSGSSTVAKERSLRPWFKISSGSSSSSPTDRKFGDSIHVFGVPSRMAYSMPKSGRSTTVQIGSNIGSNRDAHDVAVNQRRKNKLEERISERGISKRRASSSNRMPMFGY